MESSPLISAGLPLALFIIMIGIGMTLTIRDFRQVAAVSYTQLTPPTSAPVKIRSEHY